MANRRIQFLRYLVLLLAMFFLTSYSSKEETGSKEEASKPKELIAPGEVVILDDYSDFEKIFFRLEFAKDRLNNPPSRGEFESEEEYQKRLVKYKAEINKDVKQIHDQLYRVTLSYSNLIMRAPFYGITLKEPLKFCLPGYNLEEEYFALSNIKFAPDTTVREWGYYNVPVFSFLYRAEDPPIKIEKSIARRVRDIEDKLYLDLTFKVVDAHTHHPTTSVILDRFFIRHIDIQPIKMTLRGEGETFWQWGEEAAGAPGVMKDPRAVEPLIAALKDGDAKVRRNAAEALEAIGTPAVPALIKALEDKDWKVRGNAALVLGKIKDPRAVEGLIIALKDKDQRIRESAAWALREITGKNFGEDDLIKWQEWWVQNKENILKGR